jgi:hypothetical protein
MHIMCPTKGFYSPGCEDDGNGSGRFETSALPDRMLGAAHHSSHDDNTKGTKNIFAYGTLSRQLLGSCWMLRPKEAENRRRQGTSGPNRPRH